MPRVSIITPCYNATTFIPETIKSVQAQLFTDWEYILVDDGSSDTTLDRILTSAQDDSRIRVVKQQNAGVSSARNRGFREVSPASDYVIFLDSDDLWYEDTLVVLVDYLDTHLSVGAVFGRAVRVDSSNRILGGTIIDMETGAETDTFWHYTVAGGKVCPSITSKGLRFGDLIGLNIIPTPGQCLIRKKVYEKTTLFNPELPVCEDFDLWLQISIDNEIDYCNYSVIRWRRHDSNASRQYRRMRDGLRKVYKKYMVQYPVISDEYKLIQVAYFFRMYYITSRICRIAATRSWRKHQYLRAGWLVIQSLWFESIYWIAHIWATSSIGTGS